MGKTAVVTGCFGFVGSHLVDSLIEKKFRVLGVGKPRDETKRNYLTFIASPEFEIISNDVLNLDHAPNVTDEIDTVYHLATARIAVGHEQLTKVNVLGTLKVLEWARKHDVKRIVFSSSASVYGNPDGSPITENAPLHPVNLYGASKLAAENYISTYNRMHGIGVSILRYFNIYGPRQSKDLGAISTFINRIMRDAPISLEGDGSYCYTPIYVADAVECAYRASRLEEGSSYTINICGTELVKLMDIVRRIQSYFPDSLSKVNFKEPRPNWGNSQIGSTKMMRELLNFAPQHAIREGLEATVKWYSEK